MKNNKIELTNSDLEVGLASMVIQKHNDKPDQMILQLHSLFTSIVGKRRDKSNEYEYSNDFYRRVEKVGQGHSQLDSALKAQDEGHNVSGIDLMMCWGSALELKEATQNFCKFVGIEEIVITSNRVGLRPAMLRLNDLGFNIRVERIETDANTN